MTNSLRIFLAFLRLGLTSFGGPVAHIGYFRTEFVERRRWLEPAAFADLLALCQFLPGPSSSQLGLSIGLARGGVAGALMAWLGFTLPSALVMAWCGAALGQPGGLGAGSGWVHGLKLLACAVVAEAVWSLGRKLAFERYRQSIMVASALLMALIPGAAGQLVAMVLAAMAGQFLPARPAPDPEALLPFRLPGWLSIPSLVLLALGLFALPLLARASANPELTLFDKFFRVGSLVFGGGHVVLPLLRDALAPLGWVSDDRFLAGYALAQTMPGPLFTFAAYLGAAMRGWTGAALCVVAIFLPSFLMLFGLLPHWHRLQRIGAVRAGLEGVNAAVVGLLLAALYHPIVTSSVLSARDFVFAAVLFLLLAVWRVPVLALVLLAALVGTVAG